MERVFQFVQRALGRTCVGLGVAAAVVGCHSAYKHKAESCDTCGPHGHHGGHHGIIGCLDIDNCADIPKGAIPQPIGTFTNAYVNLQAGKAERDDFVIYYNEWVDEQAVLGPYGGDHLGRIASRMPFTPFVVTIQPEPNKPVLTGLRYQAVVNALTEAGIPNAADRVVVGRSAANGMYGEAAPQIYQQLIRGGGGVSGFGGTGNFAGFGGVGFGGGFGGGFGFR